MLGQDSDREDRFFAQLFSKSLGQGRQQRGCAVLRCLTERPFEGSVLVVRSHDLAGVGRRLRKDLGYDERATRRPSCGGDHSPFEDRYDGPATVDGRLTVRLAPTDGAGAVRGAVRVGVDEAKTTTRSHRLCRLGSSRTETGSSGSSPPERTH